MVRDGRRARIMYLSVCIRGPYLARPEGTGFVETAGVRREEREPVCEQTVVCVGWLSFWVLAWRRPRGRAGPPLDGTLYELEFDDSANGIGVAVLCGQDVHRLAASQRHEVRLQFHPGWYPTVNSVSLSLSLDRSHGGSIPATTVHRVSASWG